MNYAHAFHAGNFADVVKHAVLVRVLDALLVKPAALALIDTHGGAGLYALDGPEAQRTGEAARGIAQVLAAGPAAPPALARYLAVLAQAGRWADGRLTHYPGSPLIAQAVLRRQDRLVAAELQPVAQASLAGLLRGRPQTEVVGGDGYRLLARVLPPREQRGLVLIDPPFEERDEFERLALAIKAAGARWPGLRLMAWMPLKHRPAVAALHGELLTAGLRDLSVLDWRVRAEAAGGAGGMEAASLLFLRLPFGLEADLAALMEALMPLLAQGPGADWQYRRLDGA